MSVEQATVVRALIRGVLSDKPDVEPVSLEQFGKLDNAERFAEVVGVTDALIEQSGRLAVGRVISAIARKACKHCYAGSTPFLHIPKVVIAPHDRPHWKHDEGEFMVNCSSGAVLWVALDILQLEINILKEAGYEVDLD